MKFIHTSDWHLGTKFIALHKKGRRFREILKESVIKVFNEFNQNNYDLLLISGDIFDNNTIDNSYRQFLSELIARVKPNKHIVLLPGNHDHSSSESVWFDPIWDSYPNLHIFKDLTSNSIDIESLELTVFANSITKISTSKNPFDDLQSQISNNPSKYKIVLAHGSLNEGSVNNTNSSFTKNDIINLGADYVALGDWHSFKGVNVPSLELHEYIFRSRSSPAFYSGSLEPLAISQKGSGYIIVGEFLPRGLRINKQKIGTLFIRNNKFEYSAYENINSLYSEIKKLADMNVIQIIDIYSSDFRKISLEDIELKFSDLFLRLIIRLFPAVKIETDLMLSDNIVVKEFNRLLDEEIAKNSTQELIQAKLIGNAYLNIKLQNDGDHED